MAKHTYKRGYPKHIALLTALFLPAGAIALGSNTASAQRQHLAATRIDTPERTDPTMVALPSPEKTSALDQALAACNQEADQGPFTLPGLKGEITLDRCYKGRAHLICVFTTLSTEATSLTSAYTEIVDAKYPDINTVDGICQVSPETLGSDIARSEDFAKKFKELKSQYDAATNCAGNVEQAFKKATFPDLTQAPEVLKSMAASIDGDVAKTSKVYEQISNLAEKMEQSKKAMRTITKLYHAMCLQGERAAVQSGH
jgi:hypothetical protein